MNALNLFSSKVHKYMYVYNNCTKMPFKVTYVFYAFYLTKIRNKYKTEAYQQNLWVYV